MSSTSSESTDAAQEYGHYAELYHKQAELYADTAKTYDAAPRQRSRSWTASSLQDFKKDPGAVHWSQVEDPAVVVEPEYVEQGHIRFYNPEIRATHDPARVLTARNVWLQRIGYISVVFMANLACLLAAVLSKIHHQWVLAFILFVKSKDSFSAILSAIGLLVMAIHRRIKPPAPVDAKWILSLIPAYSESEEQIVKTIFSLRDNEVEPHKQVMLVILDGQSRSVVSRMTQILTSIKRPYVTSRFRKGELLIDAGFMDNVPVIVLEKRKNAGKKDSLILCHDLFNELRRNAPFYTRMLREEIWTYILPALTTPDFRKFDMVFCTDADSILYQGSISALTNAVARDKNAIAACGIVLVELEPGREWSIWNLYQQFQYSFGQFVRRRAEGMYGKVTCLPGCVTMIAVRPEMGEAIRKYAEPRTEHLIIKHQVQYLGTDRRLTYSMLSQDAKLHTLFVPEAVSETVAPQSLQHYLSQRRRWGSNAYFNDFFYAFGENMIFITRFIAVVDIIRLSMVYYRVANTILFIMGLVYSFHIKKLIPLLIVTQLPTMWFMFCVLCLDWELQRRFHKLLLGFCVDKVISPCISITVFTKVIKNMGSQGSRLCPGCMFYSPLTSATVWGMTGGTSASKTAITGPQAVATTIGGEGLDHLTEQQRIEEESNEKLAGQLGMPMDDLGIG
ncbi:MAG: hypothetical protein M1828_004606 [Chrysothrix sp. TS-e1954]|nr:MAG: hypothetical protein M1828_004606 [Chrysothrix sp. TS-e1954]